MTDSLTAFLKDPANRKLLTELEIRKRRIEQKLGCVGIGSPEASREFDVFKILALAKVPLKFWDCELQDLEDERTRGIVTKYVDNLDTMWQRGWGFFMYGPNGTGKTMLASIILKEAVRRGFTIYFSSLAEVLQRYCDSLYKPELRAEFERQILSADFLVLDDIDKAYRSDKSTFTDSAYDFLFRSRADKCLPIIVTSNVKRDDLIQNQQREKSFGLSLLSLFSEHLKDLRVVGEDRRREVLKKELEAYFNG